MRHVSPHGVLIEGRSERIPRDDLNEDEKKWVFLFLKGVHKNYDDEEYETNILLSLDDDQLLPELETYPPETIEEENKNEQPIDDDSMNRLNEITRTTSSTTSHTDLMSVSAFIGCLATEKRSPLLIEAFIDCVITHREKILHGCEFNLTEDVQSMLLRLKTPTKKPEKELTEEEQTEKLEKMKKNKKIACAEMGILGGTKAPIGELMDGMRKSIETNIGDVFLSATVSDKNTIIRLTTFSLGTQGRIYLGESP